MISGIIKVCSVSVISRSRRLRLITLTSTLIIPDITKTSSNNCFYYTSDSLWKIWLVESIQSIHNSLWTWHDKCNICCRYCLYHVKFNVCLVTKPLGVFSTETEWLNASLLFLRMNYKQLLDEVEVVYFIQTKVLLLYFKIFKWSWLSLSVSLSP